ncbi:MAG: nucleotidyltransferase domain-containing protein [Candidatus Woesearchaeota archaeon]
MKNEELINKAVEKLRDIPQIKAIILFGSYARKEEDKRSDIDLLIVLNASNPKKYLKEVIKRISPIDKDGKISPRLTNLKDYDPSLFQNVFREGKLLFGAVVVDNKKLMLQPFRLVNYDLSKLSNSEKVKISRNVYGYISKKGKKEYTYKGLKDGEGVILYSNSTVLIPESKIGFIDYLKREKVPFKEKKVWIE